MKTTGKKEYVKPKACIVCTEPEMLIATSPDASSGNVDVDNWKEDKSTDLGSTTIDPWADGDLW